MNNSTSNPLILFHRLSIIPHVIITLCLLLISIVGLVGNLTSLYVIRKILSFHTQQWFLISIIIVINGILGLSILPTTIVAFMLNKNIFSSSACLFLGFVCTFTKLIYSFTVTLILIHQIAHLNSTYLCIRHRGYKKIAKPYFFISIITAFLFAILPLLNMSSIGLGEYRLVISMLNCWINIDQKTSRIVSLLLLTCYYIPYGVCILWLFDLLLMYLSNTVSSLQYQFSQQSNTNNNVLRTISILAISYLILNLPDIIRMTVDRIIPGRISSTWQTILMWLGLFYTTITPIVMACNHCEFTQVYVSLGKLIRSSTSSNTVYPSTRSNHKKTTIPMIKIDKVDDDFYRATAVAANIYNRGKCYNDEINRKYLSVNSPLNCNKINKLNLSTTPANTRISEV